MATDRMVTSGLMVEFEHESLTKITRLADKCIASTAGDALAHTELFTAVLAAVSALRDPYVEQVVETIKDAYQGIRRGQVTDRYLKPRGFAGFDDFYLRMGQLLPEIAFDIRSQIERYSYELDVLVAGLSGSRAHIYKVRDPGISTCHDSINFDVIGSGSPLAFNTLIASGCHQGLELLDAIIHVYHAKRIAEKAPGVGDSTDLVWINTGMEACMALHRSQVAELERFREGWMRGDEKWKEGFGDFLTNICHDEDTQGSAEEDKKPQGSTIDAAAD